MHLGRIVRRVRRGGRLEGFVGWGGLGRRTPTQAACASIICEQGKIVLVEEDGSAGQGFELEGAADVVDVGVGDEDLLEGETEGCEAVGGCG